MAQFNLPQNSKIEVGEYYKDKTNSKNLKKISIKEYTKHDILKLSGLSTSDYDQLIKYEFELEQNVYDLEDLERLKAWSYLFDIGLHPRNFTVLKSVSDRMVGFIDHLTSNLHDDDKAS